MEGYRFVYLLFCGKERPVGGMNDLKAIKDDPDDAKNAFAALVDGGEYDWGHVMSLNVDTHSYGILTSYEKGES